LLSALLEKQGLAFNEAQLSFLGRHLSFVLAPSCGVRLTALRDYSEAEQLHLLDSLLVMPELQAAPSGALLDLGTGGGFPGVPLAIAARRQTTLLDSSQKKIRALQEFFAKEPDFASQFTFVALRAEEWTLQKPAAYSVVVARALASLPALVELAAPLLSFGGHFIALKGNPEEEEIQRGDDAAELVGLRQISRRNYVLPLNKEQRCALVYERYAESRRLLPRRSGQAQQRPLA
jgi:16S rRNA (guanine527-N7)-methyltransferase